MSHNLQTNNTIISLKLITLIIRKILKLYKETKYPGLKSTHVSSLLGEGFQSHDVFISFVFADFTQLDHGFQHSMLNDAAKEFVARHRFVQIHVTLEIFIGFQYKDEIPADNFTSGGRFD